MQTATMHETPTRERQGDNGWRAALVGSGIALLLGGSMHPDAPADLDLRDELATMMDDDAWIPGHSIVLVSAVLLAVGLSVASRRGSWPTSSRNALRFAAVATGFYCIEAALHLFASVDVDRLRDGDFAPVAFAHLGLAAILYPMSGLSIAYLALKVTPHWSLPQRAFSAMGIIAGIATALSVPFTLIFTELETSPFFAVSAIGTAIFSIAAGLVGIRSTGPEATRR